jgi:ATP-dependent RNA helicase DeaD
MPHEFDTYVHRIGRTGRAGRSGKAILLADPRDRRSVRMLEQSTRQPLQALELPSDAEIRQRRSDRFRQTLAEKLGHADMTSWRPLLAELATELEQPIDELATGLLALLAEQQGLNAKLPSAPAAVHFDRNERGDRNERSDRLERSNNASGPRDRGAKPPRKERGENSVPMDSYRMAVGRQQQVKVSDIVGAIANEAGINSSNIGRIQLFDDHSIVDLPQGMPNDVFQQLKNIRIRGHFMNISRASAGEAAAAAAAAAAPRPRRERKPADKVQDFPIVRQHRSDRDDPRGEKGAARRKIALKA